MNNGCARHPCWVAAGTLALLLAAAPMLTAQAVPADEAERVAKTDLNTASQADLERLPGIDSSAAMLIIDGRPYSSVADLSKIGLPAQTLDAITPLVKVGPMGRAAAATGDGADKAADGVRKGADATAKGVEKGVNAAATGVQKGASATAGAASAVNRALTGAPRKPPHAGLVWGDTATKVYYLEGDPSYGATKKGKWMTKVQAAKRGYRPAAVDPR